MQCCYHLWCKLQPQSFNDDSSICETCCLLLGLNDVLYYNAAGPINFWVCSIYPPPHTSIFSTAQSQVMPFLMVCAVLSASVAGIHSKSDIMVMISSYTHPVIVFFFLAIIIIILRVKTLSTSTRKYRFTMNRNVMRKPSSKWCEIVWRWKLSCISNGELAFRYYTICSGYIGFQMPLFVYFLLHFLAQKQSKRKS